MEKIVTVNSKRGALLWDLDGTLTDTADLHFLSWRDTLRAEGIAFTRDDFERDFGRSNPELLADLLPHLKAEHGRIADDKEATFRTTIGGEIGLLPGVAAWLAGFRSAAIPQVVCSSGPTANIAACLVELGIADNFLGLISGVHMPRGKPAPDLFLRGALAAGVSAPNCVVIEDSRHGVEAAAAAGMACVVVGALADVVETFHPLFADANRVRGVRDLSTLPWQEMHEWWDAQQR